MKTIRLEGDVLEHGFKPCMDMANALAETLLEEPICLSWYDKIEDRESPAHVNECYSSSDVPGYIVYAENRGGELMVVIGDDDYTFCYRPLGEFSNSQMH